MDNYTGPYWSNGELQTSVEFGDKTPLNDLDVASRLHDSAYAHYQSGSQQRRAADYIYAKEVEDLGSLGAIASNAVLYGNQITGSTEELIADATTGSKFGGAIGGVIGLAYGAIRNQIDLLDWNENKQRYIDEVKSYYQTDPFREVDGYRQSYRTLKRVDNVQQTYVSPLDYYNPLDGISQYYVHETAALATEACSTCNTASAHPTYGVLRRKRRRYKKTNFYQ